VRKRPTCRPFPRPSASAAKTRPPPPAAGARRGPPLRRLAPPPYAYVQGNPLRFVDLYGKDTTPAKASGPSFGDPESKAQWELTQEAAFWLFSGIEFGLGVAFSLEDPKDGAALAAQGEAGLARSEAGIEKAVVEIERAEMGVVRGGAKVGDGVSEGTAAAERARNLEKGVPETQLGPSGKPKIHVVRHSTRKGAEEAAREQGGKGGSVIHHPTPEEGGPHFHGETAKGVKRRTHHEYPD
jgi:hypothetical protein